MLKLSFRQNRVEHMVRAAATLIFNQLETGRFPLVQLSQLCEQPRYGFTASASADPVGPKLVRITDLEHGRINWDTVPYCECDDPEPYLLKPNDLLFARTGATTGKTHLMKGAYKEYLTQRVPGLSGSVSAPVARRRSAH